MPNRSHKHAEFNQLVQPYMASLYSTANRMARTVNDAEDLVQETMYKAFRSFDQFQKDTNFRAWIFKILLNTFISSYRKSVRQPHKVALEDIEDSFMYHVDKDSEMIMNEIQSGGYEEMFTDDVKRALDTIPYQFRVVIMLCDIEEFSYDEIANILEIPMGTVMSRLHRGRKLLRRKLRNYARNNGFVSSEALAEMEY